MVNTKFGVGFSFFFLSLSIFFAAWHKWTRKQKKDSKPRGRVLIMDFNFNIESLIIFDLFFFWTTDYGHTWPLNFRWIYFQKRLMYKGQHTNKPIICQQLEYTSNVSQFIKELRTYICASGSQALYEIYSIMLWKL